MVLQNLEMLGTSSAQIRIVAAVGKRSAIRRPNIGSAVSAFVVTEATGGYYLPWCRGLPAVAYVPRGLG